MKPGFQLALLITLALTACDFEVHWLRTPVERLDREIYRIVDLSSEKFLGHRKLVDISVELTNLLERTKVNADLAARRNVGTREAPGDWGYIDIRYYEIESGPVIDFEFRAIFDIAQRPPELLEAGIRNRCRNGLYSGEWTADPCP